MKSHINILITLILALITGNCRISSDAKSFHSYWDLLPDRHWTGPEYWANRLQDWQLKNGRLECIQAELPKRTLHLLSRYLSGRPGSLEMQVTMGLIRGSESAGDQSYSGFLIGAGTETMDYRRRSLVHGASGKGGGMIAALTPGGRILVVDNETGVLWHTLEPATKPGVQLPESFLFSLRLNPRGDRYNMIISASDPQTREEIVRLDTMIARKGNFGGSLALICNRGRFWFDDWQVKGSKIRVAEEHKLGPVIGTQYTLSNRILKLTAQLAPVSESDEQTVEFQVRDAGSGKWNTMAVSQILMPGYLACFRVGDWNDEIRHDYRILYYLTNAKGARKPFYYYGVIVQDPRDRDEISVAAFTGNSNSHGSIQDETFDFQDWLWFPHEDLTTYVSKHHPDLLVYTGDNVYEGRPTPPDFSSEKNTGLDYLYKWYLFLWAHGDLTRNIPAVTIPDDHDVYHGNLWGASGARAPEKPPGGMYPDYYRGFEGYWQQDQGGYKLSPALVNMIQKTQVSHLPDPYDPKPVQQGIEVYYCEMNYGGISWAVLEDRKFKSPPAKIHPEYRIVNGFSLVRGIAGRRLDSPDASLLGERQLSFLRDWAADWKGADLKVAISQTVFANLSTFPDTFLLDAQTPRLPVLPRGQIPKDYSKARDMDSNGWPQTGRNRALDELRKGYAVMIGGDQHLGSVIHHGIDQWEDAGYSFCVPSIANLWPRRWFPPLPGENHQEGMPLYTGRYFDGFGNRMTVYAVSNPYISNKEPSLLHDRAPGYGIIRLNKRTQQIIFECWPRYCDPESYDAAQYPGWPVEFQMEDNYARKAAGWLPPVRISGLERPPVIQIINEITGEIIYTLRIKSYEYQARVFESGTYTIVLGEPGTASMKSIPGLNSQESREQVPIEISFQ
jgi:alkaline phosphatase D